MQSSDARDELDADSFSNREYERVNSSFDSGTFNDQLDGVKSNKYIYNMRHQRRGLFLIINNKKFDPRLGMGERSGSDADVSGLFSVFKPLGFDVQIYHNLTCEQMLLKIHEAATKYDHTKADCFGCAILSHGDDGVVYGTNGILKLEAFIAPLKGDKCPSLVGKPKLFIMQACRGDKLDHGVIVSDAEGVDEDEDETRPCRIPSEADFLYAYSTIPGYFSWRNSAKGSWFIQALTRVFNEYAREKEILWMLTRVSYVVAYEFESKAREDYMNQKKQVPSVVSMLTKELYFK